jgi:hypothetical protein
LWSKFKLNLEENNYVFNQSFLNYYSTRFEAIDEIEDVLAERCLILAEMKDEIRDLTNYHWLENC